MPKDKQIWGVANNYIDYCSFFFTFYKKITKFDSFMRSEIDWWLKAANYVFSYYEVYFKSGIVIFIIPKTSSTTIVLLFT